MGDAEDVADRPRRLDPRFVTVQRLTGWVVFVCVMAVWASFFAGLLLAGEEGLRPLRWIGGALGTALGALLLFRATAWPAVSYRHWSYRLDERGIEICRGVLFRRVITVPRSRVQHTDVTQGPIERRFGLGTLVIYTAGTDFARVVLPGLEYGLAAGIRDSLLPRHGADAV